MQNGSIFLERRQVIFKGWRLISILKNKKLPGDRLPEPKAGVSLPVSLGTLKGAWEREDKQMENLEGSRGQEGFFVEGFNLDM